MRLSWASLAVLSACSSLVEAEPYPVVVCHATKEPVQCPVDDYPGVRAAAVFSQHVLYLSQDEALIIHWYDWDEPFDETGDVSGWTEVDSYPTAVHVRNHRVMMHELAHVAFWRETGDPDVNHAEPGGPWGASVEPALAAASREYGAEPTGRSADD
jgi:hypothetical protein